MIEPLPYPSPPLSDGIVALRPWTLSDLACIQAASLDPAIRDGTTVPSTPDVGEANAFIVRQLARADRGEGWSLAVTRLNDDVAVGLVYLGLRPQAGVVGLGYWVIPDARGQGLAWRAARLASDWVLSARGEHRAEAWVEPGNHASQRVLERAGFVREGVLRSFLSFDARRADAIVYGRIASTTLAAGD